MRDILPSLLSWQEQGKSFALATVVRTWGSSPRPVGACMAVSTQGDVVGSVSAGCVEGAVIEAATKVLQSGAPEFLNFGTISNERAWEVGLSCGGEIEVWVEPMPSEFPVIAAALVQNQRVYRVAEKDPYRTSVEVGGVSRESSLEGEVFYHSIGRKPRLLVIGAGHIAVALVQLAQPLGYEISVMDPRQAFTNPDRFAILPDHLITTYPHLHLASLELNSETYAVALSHDPKIDEPALEILLKSGARYVGALGSPVTQAARRIALADRGVTKEQLERLHGPIGLNIGAKTPEEIAISILAELIQVRHGES